MLKLKVPRKTKEMPNSTMPQVKALARRMMAMSTRRRPTKMMKRTRKMIMANNRNDMAAMLNQQSSRGSWRPSKLQRDNRNTNKMHKLKKLTRMKMTVMRRM